MGFWFAVIGRFLVVAIVGGAVALAGFPVAAMALTLAALALWLLLHYLQLYRLGRWLDDPGRYPLPESQGLWRQLFNALYRARREERVGRERLSAALQRLSLAADALPDGFVVLDAHDRIEWCNPAAQRHFRIDPVRDRLTPILHLVRDPGFSAYIEGGGGKEPVRMRSPVHHGTLLSLLIIPFGEDDKVLISRDITAIERAETMRRDFVANISHELRTPLTVIVGYLETLAGSVDGESALGRQYSLMYGQALRMQRLVEDLLQLSSLENTYTPTTEEPVDIPAMVEALAEEARALSRGEHEIRVEAGEDGLVGNREELRSAFGNLISNAVRYTPENGVITITWALRRGHPMFEVSDTGIGIASEHIPRLTERFYRVDKGRSSNTGGTGLGLAIVKHVLLRHEARLEIESELDRGSVFRAVFPAKRRVELPRAVAVGGATASGARG